MMFLKQSTAVDLPIGPFLDATDGSTAETALTLTQPDIRLKKNGGAWAQKSAAQTLSHEENGWYEVSLSATDTDTLGHLMLAVHESGALPVWREFMVLPANVYDSLVGGSDALQVHANEITAGLITAAAIATGAIDADAVAADAVTEIQAGLSTLNAAGVRSAVGMAAADLDEQLDAIAAGGGGMTVTRSTGVLLGTSETVGYNLSAGETKSSDELDLLADNTSRGTLDLYLSATAAQAGDVTVTISRRRTSGGQSFTDPSLIIRQGLVAGANRLFLGRFPISRYAVVSVKNGTGATLTHVSLLYGLEKEG